MLNLINISCKEQIMKINLHKVFQIRIKIKKILTLVKYLKSLKFNKKFNKKVNKKVN